MAAPTYVSKDSAAWEIFGIATLWRRTNPHGNGHEVWSLEDAEGEFEITDEEAREVLQMIDEVRTVFLSVIVHRLMRAKKEEEDE